MLLSKDENIKTSSIYVASLILKQIQKKKVDKISIFDVSKELKKHNITRYRHLFFGLAFLYSSGIVDFQEPFIYIKNKND
ncbi:ABC-three component system middle component 6 [Hyunsoonleella ulvae]|uniref:ABC-three component system middle component 6 n=1 Tax=Hyunsoonleella ulvae TaxID=2799948 RepID=UPI00193AABF6|nr:ABC-three component system middle component 6 [Hyunsoonleella ulvae]